jgi:hypothetical protein
MFEREQPPRCGLTSLHSGLYADRLALKRLPIEFETQMSYAIVTLKNRTLSLTVERFIEHAREVAKLVASIRRASKSRQKR